MSPSRTGLAAGCLLLAAGVAAAESEPTLVLADEGRALAAIVLARGASPAEATAAEELADYLRRASSARFEIVREGDKAPRGARIHVGPTRLARRQLGCDQLGPEQWRVRTRGETLLLCGGRPRGTLYAVYHFLEDQLGVRWWTPWDETVPELSALALPELDDSGAPSFAYRDIYHAALGGAPQKFPARSRLNGHFSWLARRNGGRVAYGPPHHVHTFYQYVPPEELFDTHPGFFTGRQAADEDRKGQLCLTDPALRALLEARLRSFIEQSRAVAVVREFDAPVLFSVSPNDWKGGCDCDSCLPLLEREGSEAGPLLDTVNALAEAVASDYPEVLIDTLAYWWTIEPPATLRARDNVVVRLAGLFEQDFSKPVTDPANAAYRQAIEAWRGRAAHLWIWEYNTTFGKAAGLPLPNLRVTARNLRYYRDHGVEGVYVQHDHAIHADMRDLKLWVVARLLEQPDRDVDALVREFTDGFYGPAGGAIRDYIELLRRAAAARPAAIGYPADPEDWTYLDAEFLIRAQQLFDRAERAVAGAPRLLRRVRFARLPLDRATLLRWPLLFGDRAGGPSQLDPAEIALRARATAHEQIVLRLTGGEIERQRKELDRELRRAMQRIGY